MKSDDKKKNVSSSVIWLINYPKVAVHSTKQSFDQFINSISVEANWNRKCLLNIEPQRAKEKKIGSFCFISEINLHTWFDCVTSERERDSTTCSVMKLRFVWVCEHAIGFFDVYSSYTLIPRTRYYLSRTTGVFFSQLLLFPFCLPFIIYTYVIAFVISFLFRIYWHYFFAF